MSHIAKIGAGALAIAVALAATLSDQDIRDRLSGDDSLRQATEYTEERSLYVYNHFKPRFVKHIYVVTTVADLAANNDLLAQLLVPDSADADKRTRLLAVEASSFNIRLGRNGVVTHYAAGFSVTDRMDAMLVKLFDGAYFTSFDDLLNNLQLEVINLEEPAEEVGDVVRSR